MYDKYTFDEQRIGIFVNSEKECKEARGLDADKNYVVIYNGESSVPISLEIDETIDFSRVIYEINTSIVKGTPKWGQRANAAVFAHMANALIYMVPEHVQPDVMI